MESDDNDTGSFGFDFLEGNIKINGTAEKVAITDSEVKKHIVDVGLAESLYNVLNCVHKIFSHHQITYWLCGGSLLGACRHQGLIPWDDDLDICCLVEQCQQIYELKDIFSKNGYVIEFDETFIYSEDFMKVYKKGSFKKSGKRKVPYPFVDIFFMTNYVNEDQENVMHFSSETHRVIYAKHFFTCNNLYPLKQIDFGPVKNVYIPSDAKSHLERAYGGTWNEEGQLHTYDHVSKCGIGGPTRTFSVDNFRNVNLVSNKFVLNTIKVD